MTKINVIRVAIPAPLGRLFDYLTPATDPTRPIQPGDRVLVPFGRQKKTGIVIELSNHSDFQTEQLKPVESLLDPEPILSEDDLTLLRWVSQYYHHPIGEVCATALPAALRRGEPAEMHRNQLWRLTESGQDQAPPVMRANAHRQRAVWQRLADHPHGCGADQFSDIDWNWRTPLNTLMQQGWVELVDAAPNVLPPVQAPTFIANPDQQAAIEKVQQHLGQFAPVLLEGVTGSGKTEVYLQLIQTCLDQGSQALVLLPEISLTPQLAARFQERLSVPMALFHSGLNDNQRLQAWLKARSGETRVLLGTRSAVFTPMRDLGLIILDEEHDLSFKQQDSLRYSARDVAVMRAKQSNIPVLLGSATPALESLYNAQQGRYQHAHLPKRAGQATAPKMHRIDCRQQALQHGLSEPLIEAIRQTLDQSEQVLLFLNQRGYAPTLMCHACGWVAQCRRCDARMVIHQSQNRLKCHHCGVEQAIPDRCDDCHRNELFALGQGTQRVESGLLELFPNTPISRIDRDSTRRKGSLEQTLEAIHQGGARILIGTQMLAKGHHFPDVTLVGILDVDAGLFSCDFRASERMAQQIVQVAGRAGRAEKPGRVLLQTHQPDHPFLQSLLAQGYSEFAQAALEERQQAGLPPYAFQALFRAEAVQESLAVEFLQSVRQTLFGSNPNGVEVLGPVPAPMLKRAGRFRQQLLLQSAKRKSLHQLLATVRPQLESWPAARKVRWSLDIDPLDLF